MTPPTIQPIRSESYSNPSSAKKLTEARSWLKSGIVKILVKSSLVPAARYAGLENAYIQMIPVKAMILVSVTQVLKKLLQLSHAEGASRFANKATGEANATKKLGLPKRSVMERTITVMEESMRKTVIASPKKLALVIQDPRAPKE